MRPVILVVEDDEDTRAVLVDGLRDAVDARVTSAVNGLAALAVVALQPPALILLDLRLPDLDGLEVARRLKTRPATAAIPIIAMTGQVARAEALAAGCDDFVAKPFELAELLARVEHWLGVGAGS